MILGKYNQVVIRCYCGIVRCKTIHIYLCKFNCDNTWLGVSRKSVVSNPKEWGIDVAGFAACIIVKIVSVLKRILEVT